MQSCLYVQAYEDRLVTLQRDYTDTGVQLVAINSNDDVAYAEDSQQKMPARAQVKGFSFPHLRDASQHVADAYGATQTPQFCVFDRTCRLAYAGKIDDKWQNPHAVSRHFLRGTFDALLQGEASAVANDPWIGCTIKWAH
ncbi:redoxin domain-containing protein [Nitrospira sp. Nam74]